MSARSIYFDHATTHVKREVLEAMLPYFSENYGNPSTVYTIGRTSKKAIEEARETVARIIGAEPREIFFTGSGTEADNWAVKGAAYANMKKGKHIITTSIEHHAVLHACQYLESEGFEVTYLPVDEYGLVTPGQVEAAIRPDTILISIMVANNEIGTIQPIAEIGRIAREKGICFHTDAVQAMGNIKINVSELNVDMLSMSAHKFYGPKGVGALLREEGRQADFLHARRGTGKGRRASTENVPGIIGL